MDSINANDILNMTNEEDNENDEDDFPPPLQSSEEDDLYSFLNVSRNVRINTYVP